jgi:YD repeat-containing protein
MPSGSASNLLTSSVKVFSRCGCAAPCSRSLASGASATYAYDEFGSRVMQTSTTSTTYYPNKYFSTMSTIVGSTTYATSRK